MQDREIIIVGAGPAGATAAMILAQAGRDVLLIDRQTFPRDKPCGDGITGNSLLILQKHGMAKKFEEAFALGKFYPIKKLRLVSPKGYVVESLIGQKSDTKSCVAPRLYFDNLVFQHALESGAEFLHGQVKEPIIEQGKVTGVEVTVGGRSEQIRAKLVLGADGATSVIGRKLHPEKDVREKKHRSIALRAYVDDLDVIPNLFEFYLYNEVLPGYAWIFPTSARTANIGLGMRADKFEHHHESLEAMLTRFLNFPQIKSRLGANSTVSKMATWQLPNGSKQIQRAFDGALLLGDAGGYVNPLTGGGIENALVSAEVAAHYCQEALKKGDFSRSFLAQSEQDVDKLLKGSMMRSTYLQKTLFRFPFIIDWLVRYMNYNHHFVDLFLEKL